MGKKKDKLHPYEDICPGAFWRGDVEKTVTIKGKCYVILKDA